MKQRLILKGTIFLLILVVVALLYFPNFIPMCRGDNHQIPFKRFSDERMFPFLEGGRPVSTWQRSDSEYNELQNAVARFPNVRSCLMDSEKEKQTPNLNRFDWNRIEGTQDARVCLFRVFSSIGSIDGSTQWFENQGFQIIGTKKISIADDNHLSYAGFTGTNIEARWQTQMCGAKFKSSPLDEVLQRLNTYWLRGIVWFTPDGDVYGIDVSFYVGSM